MTKVFKCSIKKQKLKNIKKKLKKPKNKKLSLKKI